jgi:hypothetical protein
MAKLANRAQMTISNTPGTGSISLNAAVAGFQSFSAAGINDQDLVSYVAVDGNAWEVGEGVYTASGTSLARGLVASSTGSLLSLSSSTTVFIDAKAADLRVGATRQTVQSGPITTAGLPNFLPASSVNLNLTTQNISTTTPLIVCASNGWDGRGPYDRMGAAFSNLTWTGLTASSTVFLYVTVNIDGTLTTGFTTTAPSYVYGAGTPSTTSGAFTFDYAAYIGYMGNGSTAPQAYTVFVGEVVTSGSAVTSTIAYGYNGQYDSGFVTPVIVAAASTVSKNSNLGVAPAGGGIWGVGTIIECISAEQGYAVGDRAYPVYHYNWSSGRNTAGYQIYTANALSVVNKGTGAWVAITAANWKYKVIVNRGW